MVRQFTVPVRVQSALLLEGSALNYQYLAFLASKAGNVAWVSPLWCWLECKLVYRLQRAIWQSRPKEIYPKHLLDKFLQCKTIIKDSSCMNIHNGENLENAYRSVGRDNHTTCTPQWDL